MTRAKQKSRNVFVAAGEYQVERHRMAKRLRKIRHEQVPSDSICKLLLGLTRQSLLERHQAAGIIQAAWRGAQVRRVLRQMARRGDTPLQYCQLMGRVRTAMENLGHLVDQPVWSCHRQLSHILGAYEATEGFRSEELTSKVKRTGQTCVAWQHAIYASGFIPMTTTRFTIGQLTEAITACAGRSASSIDPRSTKLKMNPNLITMVLMYLYPPPQWTIHRAEDPSTWLNPQGVDPKKLLNNKNTPLSKCIQLLRESRQHHARREAAAAAAAAARERQATAAAASLNIRPKTPPRLVSLAKPTTPPLRSVLPRHMEKMKGAMAW